MAYGKVNIGLSATKIVSNNPQRQSLILTNASTSGIVYLGPDASVTSANAATVLTQYGSSFAEDSGGTRMFMGDVYGITLSSHVTADILWWERVI